MEYGLPHSIDIFGALVLRLLEVYAFGHFGPALGRLIVLDVMLELLLLPDVVLLALDSLLLFFMEKVL